VLSFTDQQNVKNKGAAAPARFAFAKVRAIEYHSLQLNLP